MTVYVAIVRKKRGTDYGIDFPDLPGIATGGRSIEEAMDMAREALAGHLAVMVEHGEPIPPPRPVEEILRRRENRDGVVALIEAPAPKGRSVQVTITMDRNLLDAANRRAKEVGMTRSGLLAEGARRMIGGAAPTRKAASRRRSA
jgi:predicted RNase H-like HicB family nuclease